ncbi:hydrolase FUB4 [Colletotrichum spaethianum]|uniref:Hydrolase FUB4 n=1 Tax=Colletotrichum spaethianum TaxID=700344 RepID=A0AA37P8E9_9PEZI|nr:hydrolase FUB4 [Colletotrichum spaethianum]GKT47555.1 hydrolase FUB4 [Colletotrichum spaethianum]
MSIRGPGYARSQMRDAMENLEITIDELGPFDGVLGFSQGASLALAYIYDQQVHGRLVPFNFAMCFSPVLAFSPDERFAEVIIKQVCARRLDFSTITSAVDDVGLGTQEAAFIDVITRVVMPAKRSKAMLPDHDLGVYTHGDGMDAPRLMIPQLLSEKINIPTVFCQGKRDLGFMRDMSEITRGLCNERIMKKMEHSGGHQPPQNDAEVRAAVRAMEWAIAQSNKMASVRL